MIIFSVRTSSFRNLTDALVAVNAHDVFLVGENGQGKSNFLEAVYFCAYASSFRGIHDSEIATNGTKDFSAALIMSKTGSAESPDDEVLVKFERGKKSVIINRKKIESRTELLSVIPCIVFCHEDMEFVTGSPERQRWFFDQVLSLYDPVYLDDLRCYRRVLKSRNTVLRDHVQQKLSGSPEALLDALDRQFILYGIRLMEKRETAARLFSSVFEELYCEVSGIRGVCVHYLPSWKCSHDDEAFDLLLKRRAREMAAGITLSGPHRDRYIFARHAAKSLPGEDFAANDFAAGNFAASASTGQRRLLALLLRAAQARRFTDMTGRHPILLLDDVLLEMDSEKRRRFIAALPAYDQAFYTFLPDEPFSNYRKADTLVYYVHNGHMEASV